MDLMLILLVAILIVALLLIFTIARKLLKWAVILVIIFIILFIITGGSIMHDFNNIKNRINSEPAMVLLEFNGDIIMGFRDSENYVLFSPEEISEIAGLYEKNMLEDIRGNNYKVFILKSPLLKEIDNVEINNKKVTGDELYNYLIAGETLERISIEDITLDIDISDKDNKQAAVLAYAYDKKVKVISSPIFFFNNYKQDNIEIYPETIFFRFAKIIPLSWIDENINKLKQSVKTKAEEGLQKGREKIKEAVA
ncbi:hypothetical protein GF323_05085 [Candidatus Woesearchaeota archaeon]|nr:hypothetical protein [Candidatus Woesearchaeota archaeon]